MVVGFRLLVLVLILVVELVVVLVVEALGVAGAVGNDVRDVAVGVVQGLVRCGGRETGRCNNKKKTIKIRSHFEVS